MNIRRVSHLSRRDLLRGTAAGLALAPFVPLFDARATVAKPPKRLLFFYTSNGTVRERWLPSMNDEGLVLSEILEPLERHKQDLLVIDGLGYNCTEKVRGGHEGGMNSALTGSVPRVIDKAKKRSRATGISVDQHVANTVSRGLKLRSLECGVQVDTYDPEVYALSYTGPLQPVMPENDPYRMFARVFGSLELDGAAPDQAAVRRERDRRSIIDLVGADLRALAPRLATDERRKIDGHLETVRDIERTLTTGPGPARGRGCGSPRLEAGIDPAHNDNIPRVARLHTDILLAALACDLTRVGTIQHGRAGANHRLSWLGSEFMEDPAFIAGKDETRGVHSLAHSEAIPASRARIAKCQAWYASQVAELVDRLKAMRERDGSMADNTLVVWMNEMGTGSHSLKNTPWVLIGRAGGHLATGRLAQFPGRPHNGLLLSICHAMGLERDTSFGARDHCTGPLPGLTAA